jgi:two-component system, response regulator YesN
VEGKWLIADRDLNEREGLKWLLRNSSIPAIDILLASNFQEFLIQFEQEAPDIVLLELDMVSREEWPSFRELMQIYDPILLLTSAEATFEKARLAIDIQALDLMIKPFSPTKVKLSFQKAARKLLKKLPNDELKTQDPYKESSYQALFLPQEAENFSLAAFKTEAKEMVVTLNSYLEEFPFIDLHGIFPLSDMEVLLFKDSCLNITEQCQKGMRRWEEEFSEPLTIVVHTGAASLNNKYMGTRSMLQISYYKGYGQVAEFESPPVWVRIDPFLDPPEQRTWIDMLANFDLETIKQWLYNEFLHLQEPYPDPDLVRIRLTSILAQIRRYMKTNMLDEQDGFELEYRDIFNSILYDAVLYKTVQNLILFIQKLFLGAEERSRNSKQNPIERGLSFIEANFSNKGLKLEDAARYVDRNPAYFSHLLMLQTGKGFTELLTEMRIKEAKRQLIETEKSIKEIAYLVGYHHANYFSRIFKEVMGTSPREFRNNKVEYQTKGN